jgi:hypothetical protein
MASTRRHALPQSVQDLIRQRRARSQGVPSHEGSSPATTSRTGSPAAPVDPLPGKGLKFKPKKAPTSGTHATSGGLLSSQLRRSASAVSLQNIQHNDDLQLALDSGLVDEADVNHYGMRTPWAGTLPSLTSCPQPVLVFECYSQKVYAINKESCRLWLPLDVVHP